MSVRGEEIYGRANTMKMSHEFLKEITNDFSEKRVVGRGTFGTVYLGKDKDGREIAVKQLRNTKDFDGEEFQKEFNNLSSLDHPNIVQLVGFCDEEEKVPTKHEGRHIIALEKHRALCFEYMHNGNLSAHLKAETEGLGWHDRYNMIKGICEGLKYLHIRKDPILHSDLKPDNILLDINMVPKIADFGISRLLGEENTKMTHSSLGTRGYLPPEYVRFQLISRKFDIYSLGVIIIKMMVGSTGYSLVDQEGEEAFVDHVCKAWSKRLQEKGGYPSIEKDRHQVQKCIELALQCIAVDRVKRPCIGDIVNQLNETEKNSDGSAPSSLHEVTLPVSSEFMDIYPGQLCFPFIENKLISCPLQLTNKADDCVAVRLHAKSPKKYMAKMPLWGLVPPKSTYTLIVTAREQTKALPNSDEFLRLESRIVPDDLLLSLKHTDLDTAAHRFNGYFRGSTDEVHELTLKVVSDRPEQSLQSEIEDSSKKISEVEVISNREISQVLSVDVHPQEPWIMTSHQGGDISIWNYKAQKIEASFYFTKIPVYSAKFIEREKWLVAGDGDGTIYVYRYDTEELIVKIVEAHKSEILSLDVHPTNPLMLSSSEDHLIKLWDWGKGWEHPTRTFEEHSGWVTQVSFDPMDSDNFASASMDHTIKIWNISSSASKITLSHKDGQLCVQSYTNDSGQYLIAGSCDGTIQIWDVKRGGFQMLGHSHREGHSHRVGVVYLHPELPILITGSHDGTVRVWNSATCRLENIIGVNLGAVRAFGYIESLGRIVVGCDKGIAIMEINQP